tara:strand:- start:5761 stop:6654 length:894 start_codon:yes stop_codon:yes gene_type:complete
MKILVTGSNGLVGSHLVKRLVELKQDVVGTSLNANRIPNELLKFSFYKCDLTDKNQVDQLFELVQPDVVFHLAAISQVDLCEKDPKLCEKVNVDATHYVIEQAEKYKSHLVYMSTDFVFKGDKKGEYSEEDITQPVSVYGQSKLKAENLVKQYSGSWKIIRPILIYGSSPSVSRSNIVLWVRKSLQNNEAIRVVSDQYRQPTAVKSVVDACILAMNTERNGVYHIADKDRVSVIEFAMKIATFYKLNEELISPVFSSELNQLGKRPTQTFFDLSKSIELLGYSPKSIEEGLIDFESF